MQFSQTGNIEKIKKSKQFSQDEAAERTRKGRKDNKRQRGKDRSWMEEQKEDHKIIKEIIFRGLAVAGSFALYLSHQLGNSFLANQKGNKKNDKL